MAKILVVGGAGYIGSHTVRVLIESGHQVVVFDSLVNGHKESLPEGVKLIIGELSDRKVLGNVFSGGEFDAVVHFAGFIEAGESMTNPSKFYGNNVCDSFVLLDVMREHGVKNIIFSSSAAIFGEPEEVPIGENAAKRPVSVYGETKLIFEWMLESFSRAYGLKYVALRYFNAAGAGVGVGEDHDPESHLIPLVLQVALGKRKNIKIFGTDYDTKDGTAVRDYVHVLDLARAHKLALDRLLRGEGSSCYNLGCGEGYSVREIIEVAREVTGKEISVVEEDRRAGDSAVLVADSSKIKKELGWTPEFGLRDIVKSAWEWHSANPEGFGE